MEIKVTKHTLVFYDRLDIPCAAFKPKKTAMAITFAFAWGLLLFTWIGTCFLSSLRSL
jgi:hypothetical protein